MNYWGVIDKSLKFIEENWEIIVNLFWNCELKYISRLGYAGRRPAIQLFVFIVRQNSCQQQKRQIPECVHEAGWTRQ